MTVPPFWTAEAIAKFAFSGFLAISEDKQSEMLSEEAMTCREQLCHLICTRFGEHARAKRAIATIQQGEATALKRLVVYLQDEMEDDSDFAAQIGSLTRCIVRWTPKTGQGVKLHKG